MKRRNLISALRQPDTVPHETLVEMQRALLEAARPTFADALDEYLDAVADLASVRESHPEASEWSLRMLTQRITEARDALNGFFKP